MPLLAVVVVVLGVVSGTYVILNVVRRLQTPPELRGDWWSKFERDFRAYAARSARADRNRDHRRHRGERA